MSNKFTKNESKKFDSKAGRKKNIKSHWDKKTGAAARAKEQRRVEAEERVSKWSKLTFQQQLDSLDQRGFRAEKQRKRILAKMEKNK